MKSHRENLCLYVILYSSKEDFLLLLLTKQKHKQKQTDLNLFKEWEISCVSPLEAYFLFLLCLGYRSTPLLEVPNTALGYWLIPQILLFGKSQEFHTLLSRSCKIASRSILLFSLQFFLASPCTFQINKKLKGRKTLYLAHISQEKHLLSLL